MRLAAGQCVDWKGSANELVAIAQKIRFGRVEKKKLNAFFFSLSLSRTLATPHLPTTNTNSPLAPRVGAREIRGPPEIGIQKARGGQGAPEKRRDRTIVAQQKKHQRRRRRRGRGRGAAVEENSSGEANGVEKPRSFALFCPRHAQGPHGQARPSLDAAAKEAQELRCCEASRSSRCSCCSSCSCCSCSSCSAGGGRGGNGGSGDKKGDSRSGSGPSAPTGGPALPAAAPAAPECGSPDGPPPRRSRRRGRDREAGREPTDLVRPGRRLQGRPRPPSPAGGAPPASAGVRPPRPRPRGQGARRGPRREASRGPRRARLGDGPERHGQVADGRRGARGGEGEVEDCGARVRGRARREDRGRSRQEEEEVCF